MNQVLKMVVVCALGSASMAWADGDEFHEMRNDDGYCLDASPKSVGAHHCQGLPTQHWKSSPAGGGFMKFSTEANPELCLDIINDGTNNQLQLAKCTNATGQGWKVSGGERSIRLSSQWRGEGQCMVYLDGKPQVAACNQGQRSWKLYAVASSAEAAEAEGGYDGQIDSYGSDFELALRFDACKIAIPDEPDGATRVLRCRRKESDMLCTVRSAPTPADVFTAPPRLKAFRAPITADTTGTIMFATPKGKMSFVLTPRTATVKLVQPGGSVCKGSYYTHEQWSALGTKYRDAHPVVEDSPTYAPSTSSSSSRPTGPVRNAPGCLSRDTSLGKHPQSACCSLSSKLRKGDRVCD